jgi:hypothetical protein
MQNAHSAGTPVCLESTFIHKYGNKNIFKCMKEYKSLSAVLKRGVYRPLIQTRGARNTTGGGGENLGIETLNMVRGA